MTDETGGRTPVLPDPLAQPGQDPLLGVAIYGFVILRKIAEGGMGAVYLAQHEQLAHIHKVIKVLLPAYAHKGYLRQRFEREAEAASRMKHDSILKIDNFGALPDGQLWLMTEVLVGQPLNEFLQTQGCLPQHRVIVIVLQLCSAIAHAHKLGVIHRDLKPENVFVCPTAKEPYAIKLLDFGIAKILDAPRDGGHTLSGSAVGTPCYMATEQYENPDKATAQADLFSIAVMTCEMLTGRPPWGRHEQTVIYYKQKTAAPNLEGIPAGWVRPIAAALSPEPSDRPRAARDFALALADAMPVAGQLFKSGRDLVNKYAPEFLRGQPDDETVRGESNQAPLAALAKALSWQIEKAPQPGSLPAEAPTTTTISAATGMLIEPAQPRAPRWKVALATLGVCVVGGVGTFAIVHRSGGTSSQLVVMPPAPTLPAAASSPAAPVLVIDATDGSPDARALTTVVPVLEAPEQPQLLQPPQVVPNDSLPASGEPRSSPPSSQASVSVSRRPLGTTPPSKPKATTPAKPAATKIISPAGAAPAAMPPPARRSPTPSTHAQKPSAEPDDDQTFDPNSPTGK